MNGYRSAFDVCCINPTSQSDDAIGKARATDCIKKTQNAPYVKYQNSSIFTGGTDVPDAILARYIPLGYEERSITVRCADSSLFSIILPPVF